MKMQNSQIILKQGREKSVLQRHPWIFSGAINEIKGNPGSGETVDVISANGEWLCSAAFSPVSQIRARIWSWIKEEEINDEFFHNRILNSINLRKDLELFKLTDAMRLVHGESDSLPGMVVDRYGDTVVIQSLSAGAEKWKQIVVEVIRKATGAATVYERSEADVRKLEGLAETSGLLVGKEPPGETTINENNIRFLVDVQKGQKTGFYLDQRDNRAMAGKMANGRTVLNCFSYTGGFSLQAIAGGAESVLSIDSSVEAMNMARRNLELNDFSVNRTEWLEGDVFQALRGLRDRGRNFDMLILDPPKFAPTAAHAVKAARAYKDINLLAFKLLKPGGLLFTFSCSGGIDSSLFQKIVAGAALDAGVNARIINWMSQAADHPVLLSFPEGHYLKGLVCEVQ